MLIKIGIIRIDMLSLGEISERLAKLNSWALEGNSLVKDRTCANFKGAIEFVNKVAELAEKHNHHPSVIIDNNIVRLSLTTVYEKGLTQKDFELASDIEKIT